jgi:hypothetical protein
MFGLFAIRYSPSVMDEDMKAVRHLLWMVVCRLWVMANDEGTGLPSTRHRTTEEHRHL